MYSGLNHMTLREARKAFEESILIDLIKQDMCERYYKDNEI